MKNADLLKDLKDFVMCVPLIEPLSAPRAALLFPDIPSRPFISLPSQVESALWNSVKVGDAELKEMGDRKGLCPGSL